MQNLRKDGGGSGRAAAARRILPHKGAGDTDLTSAETAKGVLPLQKVPCPKLPAKLTLTALVH